MKKNNFILLFALVFFKSSICFSQSVVDVDKTTGGVRATIPLYTVNAGSVSLPIFLSYATSGVKATDIEGSAGIGWQLVAGGAITRELRGLPDEATTDMGSFTKTGWINGTQGNTINSMTLANTTNPPVYTNVATDVNFINSNFINKDTEPDIFDVSAPGLSLQLVFDKDHNIRTIPYQDVKVSYTNPSGSGITSFTITNDQGMTYVFSAVETSVRQAGSVGTAPSWFNTDYQNYVNGITYASAWKLTQMHDLYNNAINLNYTTSNQMVSPGSVNVCTNGYLTSQTLYKLTTKITPQILSTITFQEGNGTGSPVTAFSFTTIYNGSTHAYIFYTMNGLGRSFQFNYTSNVHSGNNYTRYFLTNVTDADCNTPLNYNFAYKNLTNLPDTTSTKLDYWGYTNSSTSPYLTPVVSVNPSNSSYDRYIFGNLTNDPYSITLTSGNGNPTLRTLDTAAEQIGALTQVNYASGGYTSIAYESNRYYVPLMADDQLGGGIRVKQLSHYDGINATPEVTTYSYLDPTTGFSSGAPISLPQFAFTQSYTASVPDTTKWRYSTVISTNDLSSDEHTIYYGYLRVSNSGAGSTLYQFSVPVTQWNSSTPTGAPSWSPTLASTGSTTTNTIGFLSNINNTYPFPPNTNYDFERGLPLDVTNYDGSGNKVSESIFTYNTPQTPITITAFKYDANTTAEKSYCKYYIYTTAAPLKTQVVNKLFSQTAPTANQQTTETYAYNGSLHKQLTQLTTTNSNGTVVNKYFKYVKDYVIGTPGDAMTQALLNLQAANVNIPIEQYTQVTPSGGSATTVSADLQKYAVFSIAGNSLTLPFRHWKIGNPNGTAFTPSSISSGSPNTFVGDTSAHYTATENDLAYDYSGYPLSRDNGFKHISTMLIDHNSFQPAATIDNARYDEIAFSDFDSKLYNVNFTGTTTLTTTSRSGTYANSLAASSAMSKTINHNLLAGNYIISAWIYCSGTAGTMSATITGTGGTNSNSGGYAITTSNPTLYPTGWEYVELKVPLTGITGSTINVSVSCSTAVIMDDLWAYPDIAEVSSATYDPTAFFKTSTTNTNGVAAYYSYDKFGRLLYAYDQDKNIVQRKLYASAANETSLAGVAISTTSPITAYNGVSASWSMSAPSYNSCIVAAGVTYTWSFGDGTANTVTSSTSAVAHTYTTNGTYTLSLTVAAPGYGSKETSITVNVSTLAQTSITYNNYTTYPANSYIASIVFKKHSTQATIYTLTTSQLAAGYNITPDVYDITINPVGSQYNSGTGQGYGSVESSANCWPYTGSSFTQASLDLTHTPSFNFAMYTGVCP